MKPILLLLGIFFVCTGNVKSQVKGCTDKRANNYNALAEQNDGSCTYNATSFSPISVCSQLSDSIVESSGLLYYSNVFWTINDSDNPPYLYAFDSSSGRILRQIVIGNGINTDWEDLTQDSLHIYIGDFGNNRGSRKDLRIYKIRKKDISGKAFGDTVTAEIIRFEMNDQTNFVNTGQNHDYDMEAFCVFGDSLHLFSKNWVDKKCRHYVCPKDSGFYSLNPVETLETDGQVTGACISTNGVLTLTGYNKGNYGSFIYLCWDYKGNRLLNGNKRRISIGNMVSPGQNEAVCMKGQSLYLSNEKQISAAGLHRIEILEWTYTPNTSKVKPVEKKEGIQINVQNRLIHINDKSGTQLKSLRFYDSSGRCVHTLEVNEISETVDASTWASGVYMVYAGKQLIKKIILQ